MIIPLTVKKCTFKEFEKYSKENNMSWIAKDKNNKYIETKYLKKVIEEEYRIKIEKDKEYSFIICDKFSFLIDIDGSIAKDIDNDKYEYHVAFNTPLDDLFKELVDVVTYDKNTTVKFSISEWSYAIRYHIATYYKNSGKLELSTDNNINCTRIMFTAFRVNKETKEFDRIYFDYKNKKVKLGSL